MDKIKKADIIKAGLNGFHNGLKKIGRIKCGFHKNKQKQYNSSDRKRKHKIKRY